jgi:hypothetical protein
VASEQSKRRFLILILALGLCAGGAGSASAQDLIRYTYNVRGDSQAIILRADEIATWVVGKERVVLLRGKVLIEHGVLQVRLQQGVVWIEQEQKKSTGIMRVQVYAEGDVTIENGAETKAAARALVDISTRSEVRFRSQNNKIAQEPQPNDPLYRRGQDVRSAQTRNVTPSTIHLAAYHEPAAEPAKPATLPDVVPVQGPMGPPAPGPPAGAALPSPAAPVTPVPASPGPIATPAPSAPPSDLVPPTRPSQIPVPLGQPRSNAPGAVLAGPGREISIAPRTSLGNEFQSFPLPNGEHVIVVTGGVILMIRTTDNSSLVDIEADRVVIWTQGNPSETFNNLRGTAGQRPTRETEFYLAGNVEIRSHSGIEDHLLRATEVYYDVSRDVAVAMQGDVEFRQPGVPDPIHMRAEELQRLSPTLFKGLHAEVFSSRLPSDPGLTVYVAQGTMEEKWVPRRSIFGRQVIDRITGLPQVEEQRLFDGRSVWIDIEHIPIFYLPFIQGDAHDPLGPLRSVNFNYNKIFGFQFMSSWNMYDLLGLQPVAGTNWRLDADYLTQRGPALGTTFDYTANTFFEIPGKVAGELKAYGIYDTGTDILGGGRGLYEGHPDWRGRLTWQQNVQDLPLGFSLQTQFSAISDENFLEEYFENEFETQYPQETFLYLKQQQDNWAWTVLTEPALRRWMDETEWLPRADGYLLGQSFFDLLTYNVHGSIAYAHLLPTQKSPPPVEFTIQDDATGRLDLMQELSLPFTLGPFRFVPYGVLDLTYYSKDLNGNDVGRVYGGGGLRVSIPFTRLYPDICSDLLNLNGINHKIVLSANYYNAQSSVSHTQLPQLDMLNDDVTDQSLRDIKPVEPAVNPAHGLALLTSPVYDPQLYAIRRLVDDRIDTLDDIEVFQWDIRQRWQTKRGYPGQQHIVDWMTLDLSASLFPHANRDNFGDTFAFLQYDWTWNIGDRTAIISNGWVDPETNGPRVFDFGVFLNRPDRTSYFIGYRDIYPLNSEAVIGAITYIFSPKYAMTASATYDFGTKMQYNNLVFTRMGSDLQVSVGLNYNSILSTVGFTFEVLPNAVPLTQRLGGGGIPSSGILSR